MSFTSPFPDVEIPDVSVFDYLFGSIADEDRARTALVDPKSGATTTYGQLLGQTVEVLVEGQHQGKWRGRTRQNKLVFFEDTGDWRGRLANLQITWTGPWSMQGRLAQSAEREVIPLVAI